MDFRSQAFVPGSVVWRLKLEVCFKPTEHRRRFPSSCAWCCRPLSQTWLSGLVLDVYQTVFQLSSGSMQDDKVLSDRERQVPCRRWLAHLANFMAGQSNSLLISRSYSRAFGKEVMFEWRGTCSQAKQHEMEEVAECATCEAPRQSRFVATDGPSSLFPVRESRHPCEISV